MTPTATPPKHELPTRHCRECGETFRQKRKDQVFHDNVCNRKYYRRKEIRGAQAVEKLIEWRKTRGGRKGVLTELAELTDGWIREDREAGRP